DHRRKDIYNFDVSACPGETIPFTVNDPYLRGLLEEGTEVKIVLNAFHCEPLTDGQIVLYRYSEFDNPVLRRVVGVPGDRFSLPGGVSHSGWSLTVNGQLGRGVKGEEYTFGGDMPPPLALAAQARHGVLNKNEAIVMSAFPPGQNDSGTFGVVAIND